MLLDWRKEKNYYINTTVNGYEKKKKIIKKHKQKILNKNLIKITKTENNTVGHRVHSIK